MSRPAAALTLFVAAAGCAAGGRRAETGPTTSMAGASSRPAPFFIARQHPVEYAGPGRDDPPPQGLTEVKIGWFGPSDPHHATAGPMWCAAFMALDEANQAGGYQGLPFRLLTAWSDNPWGSGIKAVTRLVYEDGVWAIVGAPDGPSAHLVEQVVAKARVTFVNPVSTDKTTNLVNVPWIFTCAPGDHVQAPVLAEAVAARIGGRSFVLISATDHDSRVFTAELRTALDRRRSFPRRHLELAPGSSDWRPCVQSLRDAEAAAMVVIAGPHDAANLVTAVRQDGFGGPIFGGPAMGRQCFAQAAGASAEGVLFPLLWDPAAVGPAAEQFVRRFAERFGFEPDYTAAYTYDGMNMLIAAVRTAGLNRPRIQDALRQQSPWAGVTGTITWDPTGHNAARATLGTIRDQHITAAIDAQVR